MTNKDKAPDAIRRGPFFHKPFAEIKLIAALAVSLILHGLAIWTPLWPSGSTSRQTSERHSPTLAASAASQNAAIRVTFRSPRPHSDHSDTSPSTAPAAVPTGTPEPKTVTVAPAQPIAAVGWTPHYFPLKALSREPEPLSEFKPKLPRLPEGQEQGRIEIRLWLSSTGLIDRVELLAQDTPEMIKLPVLEAFRNMRFRPGEIDGQPVASWSDIVIELHNIVDPPWPDLPMPTPSAVENSHLPPRP